MTASNPYLPPQTTVADVDARYQGGFQTMAIWSWRGRIGRVRFLGYGAVAYLVFAIAAGLIGFMGTRSQSAWAGVLMLLLVIPYLVFFVTLLIRRSHDMGWSGWMSLLSLIPIVGLIWVFKAGDAGANEFGAPPPPNTLGVKLAAWGLVAIFGIGMLAAIALPAYQGYAQRAAQTAPGR